MLTGQAPPLRHDGETPPTFLVTVPIPEAGLQLLRSAGTTHVCRKQPPAGELASLAASGDWTVMITQLTDVFDATTLASSRVRGLANYAVGFDNIDVPAATRAGVLVANTPGVLTDPTADVALLLMLATARRCVEADALTRSGRFDGWKPDLLLGTDVSGSTLGLLGRGRIARATARRAAGFGMTIQHCSLRAGAPDTGDAHPELGRQVTLPHLLASSDFVSVHVPLTPTTHHLLDADAFASMKPSAIVVNTARGPVVDEAALIAALRRGDIAGAGLDVYENEPHLTPGLADLPNVVLLPHVGSATVKVRADMAVLTARNATAMAAGQLPPHPVNPQAWSR